MKGARGTTLLEILVAMTILGILVSGVFGAFVFGQRVAASSSGRLVALKFAQQTVEELRGAGGTARLTAGTHTDPDFAAVTAGTPLAPFHPVRQYVVRNGKFNATTGQLVWSPNALGQVVNDEQGHPINDTNYNLKEVRARVDWTPPPQS